MGNGHGPQHPDDPRAMRAPCKASETISLLDDGPRSSGTKLQFGRIPLQGRNKKKSEQLYLEVLTSLKPGLDHYLGPTK